MLSQSVVGFIVARLSVAQVYIESNITMHKSDDGWKLNTIASEDKCSRTNPCSWMCPLLIGSRKSMHLQELWQRKCFPQSELWLPLEESTRKPNGKKLTVYILLNYTKHHMKLTQDIYDNRHWNIAIFQQQKVPYFFWDSIWYIFGHLTNFILLLWVKRSSRCKDCRTKTWWATYLKPSLISDYSYDNILSV